MNALAIHTGPGSAPLHGKLTDSGRCHARHAKHFDKYFVIAKTLRSMRVEGWALRENACVIPTRSINRFGFLWDAFRIGEHIHRTHGIDVLTVQDPFGCGLVGYCLKRRYGIPLNVQVHAEFFDGVFFAREKLEYRGWMHLGRFIAKRADTLYAGTQREKNQLLGLGIAANRIWQFPYAVFLDRFAGTTSSVPSRPSNNPGRHSVAYVGGLVAQKDLPTLFRAAAIVLAALPNTRFLLIGDGPQRERLERMATELDVRRAVDFVGTVTNERVAGYLGNSDLVVVPSLYEGTCRVILESLASGRPVVSTDVSGARDWIRQGETGYIVPRRDYHGLAGWILHLLRSPALREKMGKRGRDFVLSNYRLEDHYERWVSMLKATTKGQSLTIPGERAH